MARPTQNQIILDHLRSGKTITPKQAMDLYACQRLASRIHVLRQDGHVIEAKMRRQRNRFGDQIQFAEYRLVKEAKK